MAVGCDFFQLMTTEKQSFHCTSFDTGQTSLLRMPGKIEGKRRRGRQRTEDPGVLQSMGLPRGGHDLATEKQHNRQQRHSILEDREDALEQGMATHSSMLAWRESCGQRHLVGYSPWGCKESHMTEQVTLPLSSLF